MVEVLREVGKVQIWKSIIGGVIFSCFCCCIAFFSFIRIPPVREQATASILSKECISEDYKKIKNCTLTVKFNTKNNKQIVTKIEIGHDINTSEPVQEYNPIILYEVDNPYNAILEKDKSPSSKDYKPRAFGAFACAILLLAGSYLNYAYRNSETWQTYYATTI